jgi:hypothetical protein
MKKIAIGHNKFVLVDDEDFLPLMMLNFNWHLNSEGYAHARFGKRKRTLHLIVAERAGLSLVCKIDHKDRDKLNCQRSNLREASNAQNRANSRVKVTSSSGLKGVRKIQNGSWRAEITINGEQIYLGSFSGPDAASKAYQKAAKEAFGEFST